MADFLSRLADEDEEFARLEALQRRVQKEIVDFRADDRLRRDEAHDRAVR